MPRKASKIINVLGQDILAKEEYYLNNPNLPKSETTYTYSPEMIQAMEKCRKDIVYFAENYFFINGMNGKEVIKLFDKQKKILRTIQTNKKTLLVTSRQWGKCLSAGSLVDIKFKPLNILFKIPIGLFYFINKIKNVFPFV